MLSLLDDRSGVLAHRGAWSEPREKNSEAALTQALLNGYGIETDLRDLNGTLVISHDPPKTEQGPLLTFEWLCKFYSQHNCTGVLALNIKADGLASDAKEILDAHSITRYFAFDMSVPDTLAYWSLNMPYYVRSSEFETSPGLLEGAAGVWVDNFSGTYDQIAVARDFLKQDKTVAFVSPELHKRDHKNFWTALSSEDWGAESVQICTDFPEAFIEFLKKGIHCD